MLFSGIDHRGVLCRRLIVTFLFLTVTFGANKFMKSWKINYDVDPKFICRNYWTNFCREVTFENLIHSQWIQEIEPTTETKTNFTIFLEIYF